MTWKSLLLLLILIPIGLYLRNATYWNVRGRNVIAEDITELRRLFHRWRCRRAERKAERNTNT